MTSSSESQDKACKLYRLYTGKDPIRLEVVAAHASTRQIYRLYHPDGASILASYNPEIKENQAVYSFTKTFLKFGLEVPEIYLISEDQSCYLEEDLGDITLFNKLKSLSTTKDPFPSEIETYYQLVVKRLPRFQIEAGAEIDFSLAAASPVYDRQGILADLNYFKENFLDRILLDYDSENLDQDFNRLSDLLSQTSSEHFMYRDFQARNIMLKEGTPYFIDFGLGRKGPPQWDIVSLLYQSQAGLPQAKRDSLLKLYVEELGKYLDIDKKKFTHSCHSFAYLRLFQVLGAYGRFGIGENKPYFLNGIPIALNTLRALLDQQRLEIELPEIDSIIEQLKFYNPETRKCRKN